MKFSAWTGAVGLALLAGPLSASAISTVCLRQAVLVLTETSSSEVKALLGDPKSVNLDRSSGNQVWVYDFIGDVRPVAADTGIVVPNVPYRVTILGKADPATYVGLFQRQKLDLKFNSAGRLTNIDSFLSV